MHVKTGDEVEILAGKDKGKRGKVTQSFPRENRVLVEGANMIKRHTKARGPGKPSGIIEREAPLHASNVQLICPKCGARARTGHRFLEPDAEGNARKVRYCKKCDAALDD